ncbi:MAG: choice-of-anchor tandem repeat GloVer-containing protein, partial [Bacteroidota bacterium]
FIGLLFFLIGGILSAQASQIWGTTRTGGANGYGTIFKMNQDGSSYMVVHSFNATEGKYPGGHLIQATDGKLYGMTSAGGVNDGGVIYRINPASFSYSVLVEFDLNTGGGHAKGRAPRGSLFQASNGKLYGMASTGGTVQAGTFFSYDLANYIFTKLSDFTTIGGINPLTPVGNVIEATDGLLYGMTSNGGYNTNSRGVLFNYNPVTGTMAYNEIGPVPIGRTPSGSLVQNGNLLYGTTTRGGQCDLGTVFNFNITTHVFQNAMQFCGSQSDYGKTPRGTLVKVPGSLPMKPVDFYGMTMGSGTLNATTDVGNIYKYTWSPIMVSSVSYPVTFNGASKGATPTGSLIKASNNKLYGTTDWGGTGTGYGVVFSYNLSSGSFTKLHDFTGASGDGRNPDGDLTEVTCSAPATPASITGSPVACFGLPTNYSISAVSGATSYIWTAGGGNIQGSSNGTIITVQFGNGGYNVTVKASNGCGVSGTRTKTITVSCREGELENNMEESKTELFPNPTSGITNIKSNESIKQIIATDLQGRVVVKTEFTDESFGQQIDLTSLPKGIYFVRVNDGQTQKIVKN